MQRLSCGGFLPVRVCISFVLVATLAATRMASAPPTTSTSGRWSQIPAAGRFSSWTAVCAVEHPPPPHFPKALAAVWLRPLISNAESKSILLMLKSRWTWWSRLNNVENYFLLSVFRGSQNFEEP